MHRMSSTGANEVATQAYTDDEKKTSSVNTVSQYELDFRKLLDACYIKQSVLNFIDDTSNVLYEQYQQHKSKITFGLRTLKQAELLTRENQAAVIVACEHGWSVANALEILDDANIEISNEIRLALVKAGKDATKVAETLKFLNAEGILNIKQPSIFSRAGYRPPYTERFLSLNVNQLQALQKVISIILPKVGSDRSIITNIFRRLNEEGILLTEEIARAIIGVGIYEVAILSRNHVADTLIRLNNEKISLTPEICEVVRKAGYYASQLIDPFIMLQTAGIPLTDEFVTILVKYVLRSSNRYDRTRDEVRAAEGLVQLCNNKIPLTNKMREILARFNFFPSEIISALVSLKTAEIELTDLMLARIDETYSCTYNNGNVIHAITSVAKALITLKKAGIQLTDKIISSMIFNTRSFSDGQCYAATAANALVSFKNAHLPLTDNTIAVIIGAYGKNINIIIEALLNLKNQSIELTDTILAIIIEHDYPKDIVATILLLHTAKVPLTDHTLPVILGGTRHQILREGHYEYIAPLVAGALLFLTSQNIKITDEILNILTNNLYLRKYAQEVANIIVSLHTAGIPLSKCILKNAMKNNGYLALSFNPKLPDLLITLKKTHGASLTDDILNAVAQAGYENAKSVSEALLSLKSANLLTKNIMEIFAKNKYRGPVKQIAVALLLLDSYKVQLQNDSILALSNMTPMNISHVIDALASLSKADISLTDDIIQRVIRGQANALNVAMGFMALKKLRLPLTDETINTVSFPFERGSDIVPSITDCIKREDKENAKTATLLSMFIALGDILKLPLPLSLLKIIHTYFQPTVLERIEIQIASFFTIPDETPKCPVVTPTLTCHADPPIASLDEPASKTEPVESLGQSLTNTATESKDSSIRYPIGSFRLLLQQKRLFFQVGSPLQRAIQATEEKPDDGSDHEWADDIPSILQNAKPSS